MTGKSNGKEGFVGLHNRQFDVFLLECVREKESEHQSNYSPIPEVKLFDVEPVKDLLRCTQDSFMSAPAFSHISYKESLGNLG